MLTKEDLLLLLAELQELGIEVPKEYSKRVFVSQSIPLDILKFINDNRQLDVADFYNHIRINYNKKKSDLYINIVKEFKEGDDTDELVITLLAFALQVLLFSRKLENQDLFLKHARFEECIRVLYNYAKTYDTRGVIALLRLIKADLKAFESIR